MPMEDLKKPRSKKRGSVDNESRLKALFKPGTTAGGAEWAKADPRWIAAVVQAITSRGGACTFGLSRDGGAHSLTLMLNQERETLWFNGDADLDVELEQVWQTLETL
jgi:hypothetical protein